MRTITAAAANRQFSHVLREVAGGETFMVLSHGRPVATITPLAEKNDDRMAARQFLFRRLVGEPITDVGGWTRDELYDR